MAGSDWAGRRDPGPRTGISRPASPPGRAQPPPPPPASDPPQPRPAARPGPSRAAPSRAPQSPPRGAGGRAATPSGSLPRLRASHTSLHSAHSRRPPGKLEARGWGGPQLPVPSPAAAASRSGECRPPRHPSPTGPPPDRAPSAPPRRVLPSGCSFLAAVRLPALDSRATGALVQPLSSLRARARSSLPSPPLPPFRPLPASAAVAPRSLPLRVDSLRQELGSSCLPDSPILGNLLPPRAPLRTPGPAAASYALAARGGSVPPTHSSFAGPRHSAGAPALCWLTPCRPCSAVARLPGRSRAAAGKNRRSGRTSCNWRSARPPHLPHPGTGKAGSRELIRLCQRSGV